MSTLGGALNSAVSGLFTQSSAIATISTNIANVDTVSYKEGDVSFATLVTSSQSSSGFTGAGVSSTITQDVRQQGLIEATTTSTDLAIDGSGFFVVSDAEEDNIYYTRAGDFDVNSEGVLVNNNGYSLLGYPVDTDGEPTVGTGSTASLETIDTSSIGGNASATQNVGVDANLPANAAIGDSFTSDMEVFDSLGTSSLIESTWTKTAANAWTMDFADPTSTSDTSTAIGTSTGSFALTFDANGAFVSSTPDPAELNITGWSTGAANSTIGFDLNGLTQYTDDNGNEPSVTLNSITEDGIQYGELKSISVSNEGDVVADFENGVSYPIYQLPIATFNNPNNLQLESGNVYSQTNSSGDYTLNASGEGAAGNISGFNLENSTVDTSDQLTKLIVAQQAYSASAQIITAADDMFDALLSATR